MENSNGNPNAPVQLIIKDLHASVEGKEILRGVNLTITQGETHALMGPNGSGKSTLANVIMGHPKYEVTQGEILFKGINILELSADKRARLGIFLAFQYPSSVPGVSVGNFLRRAVEAKREGYDPNAPAAPSGEMPKRKGMPPAEFRKLLNQKMQLLKVDNTFISRYINEGFSGGEKKRAEILQMAMLQPEMAILDETDSGLDVDALRIVSEGVNAVRGPNLGVLIITHYQRILDYITPDVVHVMYKGRIVKSGGREFALEVDKQGYELLIQALEEDEAATV
ncbi:MAG: Iron-sulfur cluster assembly ATPase protein SufC [Ktedonobacterales bacterium]|jgi:Fe-S cluster assembly ATP-binding protein|nr:MAG: Iron-sulfur cluster assembly ATPase protein SufC [Ktedonobacterales bacterium]